MAFSSAAANPMSKKTPNGYSPYELVSAMQKFIRRSMEKEALFCFYEMENAGLYSIAASRLMVCVYEDCGIANPDLVNSINQHIEQMNKWHTAKNGAWRLVLGNIILQACRGKKTRIADHFVCSVAGKMANGWSVNLDDYEEFVFDKHTSRGKKMGRGLDHFFKEGIKLIESTETTDYRDEEYSELSKVYGRGADLWEEAAHFNQRKQHDLF
ncbi:MAG: hypothetical protein PHI85_05065 [Victivallaceae bacterium]|nr:hypothetical protein [Victivallaceae bacterium]